MVDGKERPCPAAPGSHQPPATSHQPPATGDQRPGTGSRESRYGGAAGRIDVEARPSFPALVALSPYKIESVDAWAGAAAVTPGKPVAITATVKASAAPGVHAINFRVYGPDGKERCHYGKTLFGPNGTATLTIPTALNEAKGKWTIKAADLASGAVGVATFEVN